MREKILLVEDEADLAMIVADTLRGCGFDVAVAADGLRGLELFRSAGADLVVADVMMPGMDGFTMARRIKSLSPQTPLLFLTAKSAVDDVVEGFEIGAGDYLRKPFELRELIVRIRALIRRHTDARCYEIGSYRFNAMAQTLVRGGESRELSNMEARVLEKLAEAMGRTVDASELMIAVWRRDDPSNRNSLHAYIHKLRRALRHDPSVAIVNQRGFGYMLALRPAN